MVTQAFIVGAGLGTRLRPLTDRLPKPLVPLFHRPLAGWTIDACERAGIHRFAINTHHLPGAWNDFTALEDQRGRDITLFHEPVLLDTGGGLANIASWAGDKPLLVHNGDIFSTLPLEQLIAEHHASGMPATLALRSHGNEKRVALDSGMNRVTDLRHELGRAPGTHVFSGIYCANPGVLAMLPRGRAASIIPVFLELAKEGKLGAVVIDEGVWLDLGDRNSYLQAHRELALGPAVHPAARLAKDCVVAGSVIGADCLVETGAVIRDSILWPGARIAAGAVLERCIVCSSGVIDGTHRGEDL
jgi:mannose-1-phosphate guanylyltransferase